jgi:hypothetical protein
MKIAPLLLILGLTAGSVPAQETMRVPIISDGGISRACG